MDPRRQDDAQRDLDEALPALSVAEKALKALKLSSLQEIKAGAGASGVDAGSSIQEPGTDQPWGDFGRGPTEMWGSCLKGGRLSGCVQLSDWKGRSRGGRQWPLRRTTPPSRLEPGL